MGVQSPGQMPWWVFSRFTGFLPHSPDMRVMLIGVMPIGVNVSVNGC